MAKDQKPSESLEESPLLHRQESSISVGKFDQARFTEIIDDEGGSNPLRIIIFIVVVIAVGVGIALLVRNLVTNNAPTDSNNQTTTPPASAPDTTIVVSTTLKPDSAATNLGANSDY